LLRVKRRNKEDLFLDLQFKVEGEGVSMVGQILNSMAQEARYRNTIVILTGDEGEVAKTTTNEYGEFRLEYRLKSNLVLVIELEDKSHLITPLPHTER
jgi:membrane-anchored protein YejM (alkaline phosphatase superfamily)